MIKGTPRITGLAVGEIYINYFSNLRKNENNAPPPDISVKAAFVDAELGTSHGWTTAGPKYGGRPLTSPAVQETFRAFVEAVELELAQRHFEDVGAPTSTDHGEEQGIAEHAGNGTLEVEPA